MYILLEIGDPVFPSIVIDEQGYPIIFKSLHEANQAAQELHDPKIVEI